MCKSLWIIQRIRDRLRGKERLCKFFAHVCFTNCQEESLAVCDSGQSSAVVAGLVSCHCLHPGCHLCRPSQHVSSQVQPLLVWVKIHPLHTPCSVLLWKHGWIFTQHVWRIKSAWLNYLKFLYFINVHNLQQAQGGKSSWQSHEIYFPNSNIYCYNFFNEFMGDLSPIVYSEG